VQLSQRTRHFVMLSLGGLMTVACAKNQEPAKQALAEMDGQLEDAVALLKDAKPKAEAAAAALQLTPPGTD
jgi:hypothetical protein